jgi:hypothetical protein
MLLLYLSEHPSKGILSNCTMSRRTVSGRCLSFLRHWICHSPHTFTGLFSWLGIVAPVKPGLWSLFVSAPANARSLHGIARFFSLFSLVLFGGLRVRVFLFLSLVCIVHVVVSRIEESAVADELYFMCVCCYVCCCYCLRNCEPERGRAVLSPSVSFLCESAIADEQRYVYFVS